MTNRILNISNDKGRGYAVKAIAIDCDDVILPSAPFILNSYNRAYDTHLRLEDIYLENLDLIRWNATDRATISKRIDDCLASNEYEKLEPVRQAIATIRELSKRYELHVVTGRSDYLAQSTERMLAHHFPDLFHSITYTNFLTRNTRPKADVCRELGADILIEDNLHHAREAATCGMQVLLFGDYPWNEASNLPVNIRRVADWDAIAAMLLPDTMEAVTAA